MREQQPILNLHNKREAEVAALLKEKGFLVLRKGWPDFLAYKGGKIVFVEVKRKNVRWVKGGRRSWSWPAGLSYVQWRMRLMLEKLALYKVLYR
jgi:hypothetical protein